MCAIYHVMRRDRSVCEDHCHGLGRRALPPKLRTSMQRPLQAQFEKGTPGTLTGEGCVQTRYVLLLLHGMRRARSVQACYFSFVLVHVLVLFRKGCGETAPCAFTAALMSASRHGMRRARSVEGCGETAIFAKTFALALKGGPWPRLPHAPHECTKCSLTKGFSGLTRGPGVRSNTCIVGFVARDAASPLRAGLLFSFVTVRVRVTFRKGCGQTIRPARTIPLSTWPWQTLPPCLRNIGAEILVNVGGRVHAPRQVRGVCELRWVVPSTARSSARFGAKGDGGEAKVLPGLPGNRFATLCVHVGRLFGAFLRFLLPF
eukprot:3857547-Pyramimonas_sp.AAC.1